MIGIVLVASLVLTGCETAKGMGRAVNAMDAKWREVLW